MLCFVFLLRYFIWQKAVSNQKNTTWVIAMTLLLLRQWSQGKRKLCPQLLPNFILIIQTGGPVHGCNDQTGSGSCVNLPPVRANPLQPSPRGIESLQRQWNSPVWALDGFHVWCTGLLQCAARGYIQSAAALTFPRSLQSFFFAWAQIAAPANQMLRNAFNSLTNEKVTLPCPITIHFLYSSPPQSPSQI